MIKELGMLCQFIRVINDAGMALLIETARVIASNKEYRKEGIGNVTDEADADLVSQFEEAISLTNRNYIKEREKHAEA